MATIPPFVATNAFEGQALSVKAASTVFWVPVGRGKVNQLGVYVVGIAGELSVLGYKGNLDIVLQLTDEDEASSAGICTLQLNSHIDEQARYSVSAKDDKLVVDAVLGGRQQQISIGRCNNGEQTECRLRGHVNQVVHLQPR